MKLYNAAICGALAVLVSVPVSAQTALNQSSARLVDENDAAAKDDATVVCKRQAPPAGTRIMGKKVCKTNAAWKAQEKASAETMREIQQRDDLSGQ